MPPATPGQQSSASACDGVHQILCSKSEATALESLRTKAPPRNLDNDYVKWDKKPSGTGKKGFFSRHEKHTVGRIQKRPIARFIELVHGQPVDISRGKQGYR